jgi:hypothetical protein
LHEVAEGVEGVAVLYCNQMMWCLGSWGRGTVKAKESASWAVWTAHVELHGDVRECRGEDATPSAKCTIAKAESRIVNRY